MNLEELAVIDHAADDLIHVICLVRIVRDYFIQGVVYASCRIVGLDKRGMLAIVGRQETKECLDCCYALLLVLGREMSYTALGAVYARSTEFLLCDRLTCYGLDYTRSREEHIGSVLYHHCEVGQSRGVYCASCARAEDSGNLRNDAGSKDVSLEDLTESGQRTYAFLDACSARVVDAYERRAVTDGHVHDLAYLLCHGL